MPKEARLFTSSAGSAVRGYLKYRANIPPRWIKNLLETVWADASSVKSIPRMTALAEPFVFFARRPAAERAAHA
jgi:hypothetical protein